MTARRMTSVIAGFRFPREVISLAVRWHLRYGLSYRDVEELLAERGITVDHVTIYRWVQRFTPEFIEAVRPCRHAPGDRWFVDETYAKVAGTWTYLYRAVDQYGQVIDVLLSARHNLAAARRFFIPALRAGTVPAEVTTDRASVYPRVLDELVPSAPKSLPAPAQRPRPARRLCPLHTRLRPDRQPAHRGSPQPQPTGPPLAHKNRRIPRESRPSCVRATAGPSGTQLGSGASTHIRLDIPDLRKCRRKARAHRSRPRAGRSRAPALHTPLTSQDLAHHWPTATGNGLPDRSRTRIRPGIREHRHRV